EALQHLAFDGLAEQAEGLVLDAAALREAGLGPGHRFRVDGGGPDRASEAEGAALPSLGPLDLVYVPCRPAPLVTTRRQWHTWRRVAGAGADPDSAVPPSVAGAVADAAALGHDDSGRFRTVADWLGSPASWPDAEARPRRDSLGELPEGDGL